MTIGNWIEWMVNFTITTAIALLVSGPIARIFGVEFKSEYQRFVVFLLVLIVVQAANLTRLVKLLPR